MFRQLAGIALGIFALGALSGCLGTAQSQTSPSKCNSSKLKAAGKKAKQKTSCWSKAVSKGIPVDPGCLTKAEDSFTSGFDKAEGSGDCATTGDTQATEDLVDALIADLVAALGGADNTIASKCTKSEFKAAGKKASKLAGCHAKAASKGDPLDPACVTKEQDSFTNSFGKATAAGDCLTTATAAATEDTIDTFIDALVLAVNPPPTTTTATLPEGALGVRDLPMGLGSALSSNALGDLDVNSGSFVGTIHLVGGLPDPATGVATLAVASDSKFGMKFILNQGYGCGMIKAAGTSGKIDCNGGTPVGVVRSINSNGADPGDPAELAVEQGAAGGSGSGYVTIPAGGFTFVRCPDDTEPACVSVTSAADCLDPAKMDFSLATFSSGPYAFTTGTGTGTLTNAVQGGQSSLSKVGVPFDCGNWASTGPGRVVLPAPGEDTDVLGDIKDTVNVFHLGK